MNGKHYIIDAHCHCYPDAIADKAAKAIANFYFGSSACVGSASEIKKEQDKGGISLSLIQSAATSPHQVKSINEFIAKTVADSPERFVGFGTLHPDSENTEEELAHLLELGLKGVKIHNDFIRVAVDDSRMSRIYSACADAGIPILLHTGDKRYDFTNPDRMARVLKSNPKLQFIGAHLAGWSVWEEAGEKLADFENLIVDCSSCTPFMESELCVRMIRRFGSHRVMFGSDFPYHSPAAEVERFLALDLTDVEKKAILGENAKRLLGL